MISSASCMRLTCSPGSGQSIPAGDSLSDSPEPIPMNALPGLSSSSVANACATITGLWRKTGAVTPVPMRTLEVAWPIAPSVTHAWPDSPGSHHGCRWSLTLIASKPARSAPTACSTIELGANCSIASWVQYCKAAPFVACATSVRIPAAPSVYPSAGAG